MTAPTKPGAAPVLRISQENLATAGNTRIMPFSFPKEKALISAVAALLALIPDGTEEQKAVKEKAAHDMREALHDNEPCLSIGIDPTTGQPNSQDWAVLAGHPDRLGRRIIYGGANKVLKTGQRGQYWQTQVRAPSALIAATMKAWGYVPTPAPKPVYGTPPGYGYQQNPAAPQGYPPAGGQGDASVVEVDANAGSEDFPF